MTLVEVRLVGGPLSGATLGLEEPLAERVVGEELQDMVSLPALRAGIAGGEYELVQADEFWPVSGALGKCPVCRHWTFDLALEVCADCDPSAYVWRDAQQTGSSQ